MKVRLQADADLNQIILLATIRREPTIDFQTSTIAGLSGIADAEVLARAAADGRVLVTHDRRTMPRHFARFIAQRSSFLAQTKA
jgi:predicted nuclease of predicted toxin-antitoxin system